MCKVDSMFSQSNKQSTENAHTKMYKALLLPRAINPKSNKENVNMLSELGMECTRVLSSVPFSVICYALDYLDLLADLSNLILLSYQLSVLLE